MRLLTIILTLCLGMQVHGALPGLKDTLDNIIAGRHVSVAVISSSGDTVTAGGREATDLASVVKFHQAAALSRVLDFDTLIHRRVVVTSDDLRRDTWSPMRASVETVPFEATPVELLDYSLNMSDNNAADILFDRFLSPTEVDSVVRRDYDIGDFAIGATEAEMHADPSLSARNRSTALDAAGLIYRFFTADTTASATLVKAVMARDTPFGRERIPAGIPNSSAKVFHKTGTGFTAGDSTVTPVNDLGFVSYPTGRGFACYALAVFVEGMRRDDAERLIADISRAVYTSAIVAESLAMNAGTLLPAGKAAPVDTGYRNADEGLSWGDILTQAVFDIVDHALSD